MTERLESGRESHHERLRVAVEKLVLSDFRNYRVAELNTTAHIVVMAGANGTGKTNLLEALSFLSPGRGLRNAHLGEITATSATGDSRAWSVVAHLTTPDGPMRVGTGLIPGECAKRTLLIDGQPVKSQAALSAEIGIVWLTPDMDRLFYDSASQRRRFLDRLVNGFDAAHAARVTTYTKVLRERARLLKTARNSNAPVDRAWLDALETSVAEQGIAIAASRRDVAARLNVALEAAPNDALPSARIAIEGVVDRWLETLPAVEAEDAFRAALQAERHADAVAGRTGTGPHRSDLTATHLEQNCPAARCSTGEQKAILISLVLAYADILAHTLPAAPILLLDEATAHLDEHRRQALFTRLSAFPGQVWLTGTDVAIFGPLWATVNALSQNGNVHNTIAFFGVENGRIDPIFPFGAPLGKTLNSSEKSAN